jgi:CDP-glucose 4,6-dehydratase
VLVTGANGFIGPWLIRALAARGTSVHGLIRKVSNSAEKDFGADVQVAQGDITNLEFISQLLRNARIDLVYHLAAINTNTGSSISPYDIFETNTRGTYTILEACRRSDRPVHAVISSSKEVEDCFCPGNGRKHHSYMASKASAELIAKTYFETAGVAAAVIRLDNIYGGGDFNWNRLVPGMMRVILQGQTPVIRSNGLLQRDYVYVEDAVAAFLAVGERLNSPAVQGQLFRVTTGTGTSVLEMVRQIALTAGRPDLKPQVLNEKTEERADIFHPPEREKKILGWSRQISLQEGLARTCQWYFDYFQKNSSV